MTLVFGDAFYPPLNGGFDNHAGYPVTPVSKITLGSPAAVNAAFISASSTISGTTPLILAATTLDVPRSVTAVGAAGANAVLVIVGTDVYGNAITETLTLNGTTSQETAQAFKTITSVTPSSGSGTSVTVGSGGKLGLPAKLNKRPDLLQAWLGNTLDGGGLTVVLGSVSAGEDDRGTVKFVTALSGVEVVVWMAVDASTNLSMVGVA